MTTTERRRRLFVAVVAVAIATSHAAGAQENDTSPNAAKAEDLFKEAKKLMADGQYAEACPKLAEAQSLNGGGGTLLALALCHEGEGKLGTALLEFRDAYGLAARASRRDRADLAEGHIRALEPRVSRILPTGARRAGTTVSVDGQVVRDEQWNTGVPVDGGAHVITATATGKRAWVVKRDIAASEETLRIDVPELADETVAPVAPRPADAKASQPSTSPSKVPALLVLGAGAVSLGVGSYFGVVALDKSSSSKQHCQGSVCDDTGFALNKDAKSAARAADVLVGVGVGLAVVGTVLLIVNLSSHSSSPSARVSLTHVAQGRGMTLSF